MMFLVPARTISPNALGSEGFQDAFIEFANLNACFRMLPSRVRVVDTFFYSGREDHSIMWNCTNDYVTTFKRTAVKRKFRKVWLKASQPTSSLAFSKRDIVKYLRLDNALEATVQCGPPLPPFSGQTQHMRLNACFPAFTDVYKIISSL